MHLASHSGKAFAKPQIISRVVLWWLALRPIPVPAILDVHHKDRVVMNDPHARLQAQVVHATDAFLKDLGSHNRGSHRNHHSVIEFVYCPTKLAKVESCGAANCSAIEHRV